MPGFTVLAVPYFFQAGQSRTSFASPLLMFMATAPPLARSDDDLGPVLVELGLGDADGLAEVLVGQLRVDDLVAVSWPGTSASRRQGPTASRGGKEFS